MKILMLSDDYLPNIGGIAAHIFHLSKALQKLGHGVVIVNPVPSNLSESQPQYGVQYSLENDLPVYRIYYQKASIGNRILRRWRSTRAALIGLRKAMQEMGPFDILHQHDHVSSTFAAQRYKKKVPWVWTNHSSMFMKHSERFVPRQGLRYIYKGVKGVIHGNPARLEKARELLGSKNDCPMHIYLPNGVDTSIFTPHPHTDLRITSTEGEFVVFCPSRVNVVKGNLYFAEAISKIVLAKPHVPWRFILLTGDLENDIANAPYVYKIESLLQNIHAQGMVTYLDPVPMRKMAEMIRLADLIVLPSLDEAVSLSALEALASRKPLIATNVGGLPEVVHHEKTGLLVKPRDSQGLADAIIRLYEDKVLRCRVAEGGYESVVKNYSWASIAQRTIAFYERVLEKAESPRQDSHPSASA